MQLISKKLRKKKVNTMHNASFYVHCPVYFCHKLGCSSKEYIFLVEFNFHSDVFCGPSP
jgi:hypothetical protein